MVNLCWLFTMLTNQFNALLTGALGAADIEAKRIAGNIPPPWGPRFKARWAAAGTIAQKRRVVQRELARLQAIAGGAGGAALPWIAQAIADLKRLDDMLAAADSLEKTRDAYAALKAKHC